MLARQVQARVNEVLTARTECRIGIADGPFAASIAARVTPSPHVVTSGGTADFLESLSVTTLDADPKFVDE